VSKVERYIVIGFAALCDAVLIAGSLANQLSPHVAAEWGGVVSSAAVLAHAGLSAATHLGAPASVTQTDTAAIATGLLPDAWAVERLADAGIKILAPTDPPLSTGSSAATRTPQPGPAGLTGPGLYPLGHPGTVGPIGTPGPAGTQDPTNIASGA
jgi:hypothetical protein